MSEGKKSLNWPTKETGFPNHFISNKPVLSVQPSKGDPQMKCLLHPQFCSCLCKLHHILDDKWNQNFWSKMWFLGSKNALTCIVNVTWFWVVMADPNWWVVVSWFPWTFGWKKDTVMRATLTKVFSEFGKNFDVKFSRILTYNFQNLAKFSRKFWCQKFLESFLAEFRPL